MIKPHHPLFFSPTVPLDAYPPTRFSSLSLPLRPPITDETIRRFISHGLVLSCLSSSLSLAGIRQTCLLIADVAFNLAWSCQDWWGRLGRHVCWWWALCSHRDALNLESCCRSTGRSTTCHPCRHRGLTCPRGPHGASAVVRWNGPISSSVLHFKVRLSNPKSCD